MGLLDGFFSLGKDLNKVKGEKEETMEGIGELLPELSLSMDDDELLKLSKDWKKSWETYNVNIVKRQEKNEKYWLGKQFAFENDMAVDNLIFEALETSLPQISRKNPEPFVTADNTEEGKRLSSDVRNMIVYIADIQKLRLKIKKFVRHWAIGLIGCFKVGWSVIENDIVIQVIRPKKLILDPDAIIDGGEYKGEFIGEIKKEKASNLIKRFPEHASFIKNEIKKELGTRIQYTEWWTNEYLFWTLKNKVLGKIKNPHWNYNKEETKVDEFGNETPEEIKGNNHFPISKMPYIFLNIFSLDKQPHDETSLIEQNLDMQDLINKRINQIDRNADDVNGGLKVSGDHFTKEQAALAGEALRKGKTIYVPSGDVNSACAREQGPALPQFVYESLLDYRGQLRNIFGTSGSTPAGVASEDTVRGKIIVREQDLSRSSILAEYIEQSIDYLYNWLVQMMYVYYDEKHSSSILGKDKGMEYFTLINTDFNRKLRVSVKEGSLIPHDPLTERNEAIDLWSAEAIDPITLYDKLDFPDPKESARKLITWQTNPALLLGGGEAQPLAPEIAGQEITAEANPPLPPLPLT